MRAMVAFALFIATLPGQVFKCGPGPMAVPPLSGTVSMVKGRLLSIRITDNPSAAEVRPGYSFAVWSGSTYKGEARVMEAADGIAFCTAADTKQGTTIQPGDCATTHTDSQELGIQCTQVTMPPTVAAAAGLAAGKVVQVDEAAAGKVLKAAITAKGTLHNLPEARVLPLRPCVMIKQRREDSAKAEAEPFARSEVRVLALPLGEDEAWFAVQWRATALGAIGAVQAADAGAEPQFETAMRLKAGKGAMIMSVQGQHAVVLWVRFCFTRTAEPAHEESKGKGG